MHAPATVSLIGQTIAAISNDIAGDKRPCYQHLWSYGPRRLGRACLYETNYGIVSMLLADLYAYDFSGDDYLDATVLLAPS